MSSYRTEIFFIGRYAFRFVNGRLFSLQRFASAYPTSRVCIFGSNIGIVRIEIQDGPESQAPKGLSDPDAMYARIIQGSLWAQGSSSFEYPEHTGSMWTRASARKTSLKREQAQFGEAASPFFRAWDFKNGVCKDLKVFSGRWNSWRPASNGRPAAMIAGREKVAVRLPVTFPKQHFRVRATASQYTNLIGFSYQLNHKSRPTRSRIWRRKFKIQEKLKNKSIIFDAYCIGKYVIRCFNGVPVRIDKYADFLPGSSPGIVLQVQEAALEGLEIHEITLSEIPVPFRSPELFWAGVQKNTSWREETKTVAQRAKEGR